MTLAPYIGERESPNQRGGTKKAVDSLSGPREEL